MDKYLVCNADESEPGTFKDRELMQKCPHMLIEGIVIAALGAGINARVHLHPRRVRGAGADPRPRDRAGRRRGLHRRADPRQRRSRCSLVAAPRRRRLHLRRGDRPARLARGQARQPAPEAAVPGDPGPLPGPDADQQRRDADDDAPRSSAWAAPSTPSSASSGSPGTKVVSVSGHVQRPGNYEIELGIPSREIIYGLAGGPPRRALGQALVPGRLELAGADGRATSTSPTTSTSSPRPAHARLGRDHRRRRLDAGARRRAEASRSSTATSPAASARPAARARTGR